VKKVFAYCCIVIVIVLGTAYLLAGPETENDDAEKEHHHSGSGERRKTARNVLKKHKDAIVSVRLVVKIKTFVGGRPGGESEQKVQTNGVAVLPSGLTIISNSATDPTSTWPSPMGGSSKVKREVTITDVKIVLNDGKELAASVVLRDKDIGIAFVRPDKTDLQLPSLKLVKAEKPKVLDPVILISRLDDRTGREPFIVQTAISAVVRKPRLRYRTMGMLDPGLPVFDAEGHCVGISLISATGSTALQSLMFGSPLEGMMGNVLPVSDIVEAMKQVPAPKK
jgi:hypothetical protein